MVSKKSWEQIIKISAGVFLGIVMSPQFLSPVPVLSQPGSDYQDTSESSVEYSFNPPSRGAPAKTSEGGSRGCSWQPGQKLLSPLIPSEAMAFTVSEYPSFFWYLPPAHKLDESAAGLGGTVQFMLIDENQNIVYHKKLSVPSSGIMSHTLSPEEAEPLAENKQYHWLVSMVCDSDDPSANALIDGWVERIPVSEELQVELENAKENDLPYIYAREGIWHEALTTLAQLRQQNPDDETILSRWSEFLRSVNLSEFTEEPLIDPGAIVEPRNQEEMS